LARPDGCFRHDQQWLEPLSDEAAADAARRGRAATGDEIRLGSRSSQANDGGLELVERFPGYRPANRILWCVWRRLLLVGESRAPVVLATGLADRWASRYVSACTIFHGLPSLSLAIIKAAKRAGAVIILDNAALHFRDWRGETVMECESFGVPPRDCDSVLPEVPIRRVEREYQECDKIMVPSACRTISGERYLPRRPCQVRDHRVLGDNLSVCTTPLLETRVFPDSCRKQEWVLKKLS
jgi:hypothetical protein